MTIADLLKLIELSQVINTYNLKFDVTNENRGVWKLYRVLKRT